MSDIKIVELGNKQDNKFYSKRLIVYAIVDNMKIDERMYKKLTPLYLYEDHLEFTNPYHEFIKINNKDINKLEIKLCARFKYFGIFSENNYYLDLDFYVGDLIYRFEAQNMQTASQVIHYLKNRAYIIEDPVGVFNLFEKHPVLLERTRYLQANYKKIAKEFNLEYPNRGNSFV